MWDLPGPGVEPVSPVLAGGFLTTAPPGKPSRQILNHCAKREAPTSLLFDLCFVFVSSLCTARKLLLPGGSNAWDFAFMVWSLGDLCKCIIDVHSLLGERWQIILFVVLLVVLFAYFSILSSKQLRNWCPLGRRTGLWHSFCVSVFTVDLWLKLQNWNYELSLCLSVIQKDLYPLPLWNVSQSLGSIKLYCLWS